MEVPPDFSFFSPLEDKKGGGGRGFRGKINKTWPAFSSSEGC